MQVYADNAATTKMSSTAIEAMLPYMETYFGNPSSLHSVGQQAKEGLQQARAIVAEVLGCQPNEIYFTSGGSEADNQAIISAALFGAKKGKKHIISTAFEHHAVLHTLNKLEQQGFEITLLDVHQNGIVTPEQVAAAIREDTCLVTIRLRQRHCVLFHGHGDDQGQANLRSLGADQQSSGGGFGRLTSAKNSLLGVGRGSSESCSERLLR